MDKTAARLRTVSIQSVLDTLPDRPSATSRERDWRGITLDIHGPVADFVLRSPAHDHHLVCYCPSGSGQLIQGRDGVIHDGPFSSGMSLIMPAGFDSTWAGDAAPSVRMRLPKALILSAAEQVGHRGIATFEIRNVFETRDPTIERIAQILLAELERAPHFSQALISETMSCALAAHLLRSYNAFELPASHQVSTLGRAELAMLTDFIDQNLERSIGLAELAAVANVSRFHFARLFKRTTGHTAIRFVEQCRIRRAQSLIAESDMPLAEVALSTGFADQSHFTRRFHRYVGCTPAAFARDKGRRRPGRSHGDGEGLSILRLKETAIGRD